MVFSSITFIFYFLPVVLMLYVMVPKKMRNLILFMVSLFFYAWGEPKYIVIMLVSTMVDYTNGIVIDRALQRNQQTRAKLCLALSMVINIGLLGVFKYGNFLIHNMNTIFDLSLQTLNVALPIGISFYTFQTMSYTIDVYRRKVPVQKNIIAFGAYVTLFPQLIAGPIVTYSSIAKQMVDRKVTIEIFSDGVRRFIIGLAKKVLLANNIGYLFDTITNSHLQELSVATAWLGMIAYTFQIYFDFSGYSDMAIGLGKMFGFHFNENFNYPYVSRSITEFWTRWHISLSSWFREYVYIPLGGNRKGFRIQMRNIVIVWMLTGIWHGASWNFIIWGIYYAILLIIEKRWLLDVLHRLPKVCSHLYTMLFVILGWAIFAFDDWWVLSQYLQGMFGMHHHGIVDHDFIYYMSSYIKLIAVLCMASTSYPRRVVQQLFFYTRSSICSVLVEPIGLGMMFILSIANIVNASYNPFLYFRF